MTDLEAIERRVSRRAYLTEPLDPEQVQALELLARQCSRDAELNIRSVQKPAAQLWDVLRRAALFCDGRQFRRPLSEREGWLLWGEAGAGGDQAWLGNLLGWRDVRPQAVRGSASGR